MKEERISFETAKLAKEKGFDLYCVESYDTEGKASSFTGYSIMKAYNKNSSIHLVDTDSEEFEYPDLLCTRPTQSRLQKWLRETHNIFVYVDYQLPPNLARYNVWNVNDGSAKTVLIAFGNYEKALEAGLLEALKLIPNETLFLHNS